MADLRISQQHLEVGYKDDWNEALRISQQHLEVGYKDDWNDSLRVSQQHIEVGYLEGSGGVVVIALLQHGLFVDDTP